MSRLGSVETLNDDDEYRCGYAQMSNHALSGAIGARCDSEFRAQPPAPRMVVEHTIFNVSYALAGGGSMGDVNRDDQHGGAGPPARAIKSA